MAVSRNDRVLIAGGGIGGLAAALALARAGIASCVLERRGEWSEDGAGIQLSPNAIRVLAAICVKPSLEAQAGRPSAIVVRDAGSGGVLQRLPLGDWLRDRHGQPYWQVHRRDVQAALLERARQQPLIELRVGFEVAHHLDEGGRVRVHATNGGTCDGLVLIGADGVFSRVRRQLWGGRAARYAGFTAARTVVALAGDAAAINVAGDGLEAGATGVWLSRGAHIVHYPVRGGRELALVVIQSDVPEQRGWSQAVPAGEIEAALERLAPRLTSSLKIPLGQTWRRWALYEADEAEQWSKGRVTLLGDAAHPTLPFLAQGGALALEDAWTLAVALATRKAVPAEWPDALCDYERARRARARRVVVAARRNGAIFHLGGVAALARNAAMRLLPPERVMAGYDWLYGWQPEAMVEAS